MGDPRKLSDLPSPAPGTSALATWGLWRRIVKSPEALAEWRSRNPEQAAAEDRSIEEARAAARAQVVQERHDTADGAGATAPREDVARQLRAAGAPPERVADWMRTRDAPADRLVRAWLREVEHSEAPHILILTGNAGTGKTVAALDALAWALGRPGRRDVAPRFAVTRELVALGRWGEAGERFELAKEARFLILDELVGGLDAYRADRLEELLCRRYDAGWPTVITSNLAPRALLDKRSPTGFGERVASRLGDKRACRIMECGTKDLRRNET